MSSWDQEETDAEIRLFVGNQVSPFCTATDMDIPKGHTCKQWNTSDTASQGLNSIGEYCIFYLNDRDCSETVALSQKVKRKLKLLVPKELSILLGWALPVLCEIGRVQMVQWDRKITVY